MATLTEIKQQRQRYLFIIIAILTAAIIGVTVWVLQQRTVINPHAAASTTLAFNQTTVTTQLQQPFSDDIVVDPGNNQVSLVKLILSYDDTQVSIATGTAGLDPNLVSFPQTLQPPITSCSSNQCTITATFSIGADPTKAITSKTTLATLHGMALQTGSVTFSPGTEVFSLASADQANENVLFSTSPLTVTFTSTSVTTTPTATLTPTPTQKACVQTTANCIWDNLATATNYHYVIKDETTGVIVIEGDLTPPQTNVSFSHQQGDTYSCTVTASNACKTDQSVSVTNTCPANPTATPTATMTLTPTQTLQVTEIPTMQATATPTPTPQSTAIVANSPTGIPTATPAQLLSTGPGDTFIQIGIAGVVIAIIGGLLLFGL